jgi:hypothetical protein
MNVRMAAALIGAIVPALSARADQAKPPLEVSSVAERALAARPGDSLLLMVGDRITVARIDRAGITSRGIHLQLAGARLRGEVGGQAVALDLGDHGVDGHIGASQVSMDVARGDTSLNVRGRFGARGISLQLSPASVTAEVGPCRYALKFQHNEYAGQVACGGDPEPVHMRVPASLVARGDVELVALFTSLLAR